MREGEMLRAGAGPIRSGLKLVIDGDQWFSATGVPVEQISCMEASCDERRRSLVLVVGSKAEGVEMCERVVMLVEPGEMARRKPPAGGE